MPAVKGSRRTEAARATRRVVLATAAELFASQGYAATTIDQVAAGAGVSRPTVFSVGSKAGLLKQARDVAMAGDDEARAVSQRESVQRVLLEPDALRSVGLLAAHVTGVQERYGPLDEVLRQAAATDPELAALWRASEEQRLVGATLFTDNLGTKRPLVLPRQRAIDALWVLMAPDLHLRLVRDRGWPRRSYVTWLGHTIGQQLLAA